MTHDTSSTSGRRTFLSRLVTVGAALGFAAPWSADALERPTAPGALPPAATDDPWIARLKGKHRVVFHSHLASDGIALRWAKTYLDTQKSAYGLTDADSSVVVGLNGRAIGLLFNDAIWGKYPIGETLQMPGSRNANTALVAQLVARGVTILACNNSIRASGQRFLPESQRGGCRAADRVLGRGPSESAVRRRGRAGDDRHAAAGAGSRLPLHLRRRLTPP